jgi:glutamate/tyrosine decarboxylase-like PLP-dependent enzyme
MDAARPLPREGSPTTDLLDRAATLLFDHSLFNGHPSFWGYITSSPAPIGMLGDFLASAVNANCGAWLLSPMASEIEAQTVRWIAEMLGYPTGWLGAPTRLVLKNAPGSRNAIGRISCRQST